MTACPPITTWGAPASYTYAVRIEQGTVSCAEGRGVLRHYIVTATTPGAWTCFRGHTGDSWAAACARGNVLTRAYGPKRERDPWRIAAARLTMPVVAPPTPDGLTLRSVTPQELASCGATKEEVSALYQGGGKELYVIEGKPRVCGDVGDAKQVARPRIHGRPGTVLEIGAAEYPLIWSERGVQIGFQTRGYTIRELVGLASAADLVLA